MVEEPQDLPSVSVGRGGKSAERRIDIQVGGVSGGAVQMIYLTCSLFSLLRMRRILMMV